MTQTFLTPERYLQIERKAEFRSEYFEGEMHAVPRAIYPHIVIMSNLGAQLAGQLRKRSCAAMMHSMRVRANTTGFHAYPDLVVVCGEPQFLDDERDTLLNPKVIIEVLSDETEAYDRGRKFERYRVIESLRGYLVVCSDRMHVDQFTRGEDGRWWLESDCGADETIEIPSIDCRLALADIYAKADLGL